MNALIHASMAGAAICLVVSAALIYKKNKLWKQFAIGAATCLLLFFASSSLEQTVDKAKKLDEIKPTAPLIKYEIQSIDAPSPREVAEWRKGLLCELTYNVKVEKNDISEAEFETIALDIIEKDAKARKNWNAINFYLRTPESIKTAVAYMSGYYALNGKLEQSNKLKPGTYNNNYKLITKIVQ